MNTHRLINRTRRLFGLKPLPRRCCRTPENLGPVEPYGVKGVVKFQRCQVCGVRHFVVEVEPGKIGLKVAGM